MQTLLFPRWSLRRLFVACVVGASFIAAAGCATGAGPGDGGAGSGGTGGSGGAGGAGGPVLPRSNRSTPINITTDDAVIASVNPDNDTISFISASTKAKIASVSVPVGSMPVSIAIHPDNATAFVVLRKSQKLVKVTGINTVSPALSTTEATVGSEPTGVALSPSGATAVVANFGETSVSFVTTGDMTATKVELGEGANPRAVAVTNNGDTSDGDETAYVTQFYGAATAEASDTGRTGKVFPIPLATKTPGAAISLAPITDTGFGPTLADGGVGPNVSCAPNQLFGIAIDGAKAYVTHVCASPKGPVQPLVNLFAAVSVINLATNTEDTSTTGTVALSKLLKEQDVAGTSNLLGVPVAIDFKANNIAYVASQAGDVVQRVQYSAGTPPIRLGTATGFAQIDIKGATGIKGAIGLISAHTAQVLYVNNWLDKSVTVVNLANQAVDSVVRTETLPTAGTPEHAVQNGKKFYFTATGRWATRGVSSCGSCHPDGLSDNLTWVFAAGPRQTIPMDATFAKANGSDQRALNWTAIFDEVHDFEGNTRGTSGGIGAIVSDSAPVVGSRIDLSVATSLDGGVTTTQNDFLAGSAKTVVTLKSVLKDWDEIESYSRTIHANKAPTTLNSADVTAGRTLFTTGKCHNCHGGAKWTVSRVSFNPSPERNGARAVAGGVAASGLRTQGVDGGALTALPGGVGSGDTVKVSVEGGALPDGGAVGPERITCVLRKVGTFDIASPIEKKADGTQAQGLKGFNPPSLLGLATSAPYFHHGASATLDAVFTDATAATHLASGNANFTVDATQRRQLVAFLRSIDESTATIAPEVGADICSGY